MNKNKILCLCLIVILGLSLYGCKKDNKEPNNNQTVVEKATYDENETAMLFSKFGTCSSGYKLDFGEKNELKYSDLPDTFKNNLLFNYLKHNKKVESNKEDNIVTPDSPKTESFAKSDLESAIKNVFGDVEYGFSTSFDLGDYSFNLDENTKKYNSERNEALGCGNTKLDGYDVNSIYVENNKLYVNVIYYRYEYLMNSEGYAFVYYGTKDDKRFENPEYYFLQNNQEHFYRYLFVFVPKGKVYVFDHVELIDTDL